MRFGVQVFNHDFAQLRDTAQQIEELGFDRIMLPDHVVMEGPERQRDPRGKSFDPILSAGIIAAATKKVHVGHLVLCNLFRHPVFTAQCLTSLDHLSGGRAFLGLGSGWTETEFRMTGISFPDIKPRLRMLDEALTCIRSLWTQEATTFEGEFYRLKDAVLEPKPVQKPQPKIVLGGGGKGLLRLAGKHADVINLMAPVGHIGYIKMDEARRFDDATFRDKVQFVRAEAAKHGRSIEISHAIFQLAVVDSPEAAKSMTEAIAGAFGFTPDEVRRSPLVLIGTPEECIAELRRRIRAWDLSEIVFSGSLPESGMMERVAREIVAPLRG
jgi:probable F420-dependent oxidoreductase